MATLAVVQRDPCDVPRWARDPNTWWCEHVAPGGNPSGKGSNPVEILRALSLTRSTTVLKSMPSDALS